MAILLGQKYCLVVDKTGWSCNKVNFGYFFFWSKWTPIAESFFVNDFFQLNYFGIQFKFLCVCVSSVKNSSNKNGNIQLYIQLSGHKIFWEKQSSYFLHITIYYLQYILYKNFFILYEIQNTKTIRWGKKTISTRTHRTKKKS